MISEISDNEAKKLLQDHAKYKIFVAKSVLNDISTIIPLRPDYDTLVLETYVETFLFFVVSAQDVILREINKKFNLINNRRINPYSIIKNLNNSDTTHTKIKKILEKYFNAPYRTTKQIDKKSYEQILSHGLITETMFTKERNGEYYQTYWHRESTRLWELRKLRNQITHERIMSTNTYVGSKDAVTFVINLTEKVEHPIDFIEIEHPYDYLSESLDQTTNFVNEIRQILS